MRKIALLVRTERQNSIFDEKYFARLRQFGELKLYDRNDFEDREYVLSFVKDATMLITSWESPAVSKDILEACPGLKIVFHAAGSVKPVVTEEFIQKGIPISNSAIALGEGVAETALGFAISACKGFYSLSRDTRAGLWDENIKTKVKDFYDITVGIIGGGFVGRHMVKLLKNFHVKILLYDPILGEAEIAALGAKKAKLPELMEAADVVSIHAPAIPATNHMINRENLGLMKDGAVLINTARGSIIDEEALIETLGENRIFACIDVTDPEPPQKENALRSLDNVVLTPHIAGAVTNGLKRVALHVCEEVERFCNGQELRTPVELMELSKLA